jgi:hypothetical protein
VERLPRVKATVSTAVSAVERLPRVKATVSTAVSAVEGPAFLSACIHL